MGISLPQVQQSQVGQQQSQVGQQQNRVVAAGGATPMGEWRVTRSKHTHEASCDTPPPHT